MNSNIQMRGKKILQTTNTNFWKIASLTCKNYSFEPFWKNCPYLDLYQYSDLDWAKKVDPDSYPDPD
jgi:hypothetical protein